MQYNLKNHSKQELEKIILEMNEILSEDQRKQLQKLISRKDNHEISPKGKEEVQKIMSELASYRQKIDDGTFLMLREEYYNDDWFKNGESEWEAYYEDKEGIAIKIKQIIQIAEGLVVDKYYTEAANLFEWLWKMQIQTKSTTHYDDDEFEEDTEFYEEEESDWDNLSLQGLYDHKLIQVDLTRLALNTLYAVYQTTETTQRAERFYEYFSLPVFKKISIEDVFDIGPEFLENTELFWKDWIALLETKQGELESRLLKEAVLYTDGLEGLEPYAKENACTHPSLYLDLVNGYKENHQYSKALEVTEKAMNDIPIDLKIRSKIAFQGTLVSSELKLEEKTMELVVEIFKSDSTIRNLVRFFANEEIVKKYGGDIAKFLPKSNGARTPNSAYEYRTELAKNTISNIEIEILKCYIGDFDSTLKKCKSPEGSLGWSSSFIGYGLRFLLLQAYDADQPSKAAQSLLSYISFSEDPYQDNVLPFEEKFFQLAKEEDLPVFWYYLQEWKKYHPLSDSQIEKLIRWAEPIVHSRVEAIVGGTFRRHYYEVAALLSVFGDVKEQFGLSGSKQRLLETYKKKYPHHHNFQSDLKELFR